MYVSSHGLDAVVLAVDEKIEKKQEYSEVVEYTPDIQSKEGVRSDKKILCSVGVDVGVDVCGNGSRAELGEMF